MISQDAGSILASMVMHNSGEPHTNAKTIMAEPELNDLRSPSVHVCSVAVDFATAHHRQTQKLANQKQTRCNTRKLVKRPSPVYYHCTCTREFSLQEEKSAACS